MNPKLRHLSGFVVTGLDVGRNGGINYSGLYFSMFVHGLRKEES